MGKYGVFITSGSNLNHSYTEKRLFNRPETIGLLTKESIKEIDYFRDINR